MVVDGQNIGYTPLEVISNEEILKLVKKCRTVENKYTKQKIVMKIFRHNLKFIIRLYYKYSYEFSIDEFISYALEETYNTIEEFELDMETNFLTFLTFKLRGLKTKHKYDYKKKVNLDKCDSVQYTNDIEQDTKYFDVADKSIKDYSDNNRLFRDIHRVLDESKFNDEAKKAFKIIFDRDYSIPWEAINQQFNKSENWVYSNKAKMYKYIKDRIDLDNYDLVF